MPRVARVSLIVGLALVAGVLLWQALERPPVPAEKSFPLAQLLSIDEDGFARADKHWEFRFPDDHGAHPEFRSETWSFTGNLEGPGGQRFGFQLALFRLALSPDPGQRSSAWAANQIYGAQFALTDASLGEFRAYERVSRAALGLSGSSREPLRVWLEDWSLEVRENREGQSGFHLAVDAEDLALALRLDPKKPPLTQGDVDLLDAQPSGRGSFHFYFMPRLEVAGTLRVGDRDHRVRGTAWLDRAWGAVPLSRGQIALNRFALQLADGRDLLCLQLRRRDGSGTPIPSCLLVADDGSVRRFGRREIEMEAVGDWRSVVDGSSYPLHWRLTLPAEGLDLRIAPVLENQELNLSLRLWRGAVKATGASQGDAAAGWGYLELSGYAGSAGSA
ncbi:MAG: lipocalin-like domain-containing protein [Pseudomonadota bacterium]|nr:lipocalin-like domain-containing protein [Pseudomonadota bacterium]